MVLRCMLCCNGWALRRHESAPHDARCVEVVNVWGPCGGVYSQLLLAILGAIVATQLRSVRHMELMTGLAAISSPDLANLVSLPHARQLLSGPGAGLQVCVRICNQLRSTLIA